MYPLDSYKSLPACTLEELKAWILVFYLNINVTIKQVKLLKTFFYVPFTINPKLN